MTKNTMTPMIIAYDLDETLSVVNMMHYASEALNMDGHAFFKEVYDIAKASRGSMILCCLGLLLQKARQAGLPVTREGLRRIGARFEPFPGLPEWFERINAYGVSRNVEIRHFVITCNVRDIVEGTPLAGYLARIYGSAFLYDEKGEACWPAHAVDYTGKTQFLFRISKGCLEEYDDHGVNARLPAADKEVPFTNMVYVGDGETDVPCMTVVREKGGRAFAVYNPDKPGSRETADSLAFDRRVDRALPADYTEHSRLDRAMKAVVDEISARAAVASA